KIKGWYSQEFYVDQESRHSSATVRFEVPGGFWERLIDKPERFGKRKARFKYGLNYKGTWWATPGSELVHAQEIWIVEGIFDAIALFHKGITAVAAFSCNNYPETALTALSAECRDAGLPLPKLV